MFVFRSVNSQLRAAAHIPPVSLGLLAISSSVHVGNLFWQQGRLQPLVSTLLPAPCPWRSGPDSFLFPLQGVPSDRSLDSAPRLTPPPSRPYPVPSTVPL